MCSNWLLGVSYQGSRLTYLHYPDYATHYDRVSLHDHQVLCSVSYERQVDGRLSGLTVVAIRD